VGRVDAAAAHQAAVVCESLDDVAECEEGGVDVAPVNERGRETNRV